MFNALILHPISISYQHVNISISQYAYHITFHAKLHIRRTGKKWDDIGFHIDSCLLIF